MRTIVLRLVAAVVLATASWLTWSEAALADRIGDAKQQIATLQFARVDSGLEAGATLSDYLPQPRRLSDEARIAKATVAYWLGQYGNVTADTDDAAADPEILLASANAAFREAQREVAGSGIRPFDLSTGSRSSRAESRDDKLRAAPSEVEGRDSGSVVQRLDGVLNAYASALKSSPRNADAAYNYEFVARLRDQIARTQGRGFKPPPVAGAAMAGDLPAGPTIHGRPGAPPADAKMEELQMLAPMEYGDREAQPEATPGAKRERKG